MPETLPALSNLEMPAATGAATSSPAGDAPPTGLFAGMIAELMEAVAALGGDGEGAAGAPVELGKADETLPGGGKALPPDALFIVATPFAVNEAAAVAVAADRGEADVAPATPAMGPGARVATTSSSPNPATAAPLATTTSAQNAAPPPAPVDVSAQAGATPTMPVAVAHATAAADESRPLEAGVEGAREASPKTEAALPSLASAVANAPAPRADGALRTELAVPFRQPGWGEALGSRVVWLANQQIQSAELHLNPPQLGPIEVQIRITDNQASIEFGAHQALVRDAIESALPRLREMFAAQGLNLADVNVSQQSFARGREQPASRETRALTGHDPAGAQAALTAAAAIGLVDLYA